MRDVNTLILFQFLPYFLLPFFRSDEVDVSFTLLMSIVCILNFYLTLYKFEYLFGNNEINFLFDYLMFFKRSYDELSDI